MRLCDALEVRQGDIIALTGAEGMPSALVHLGHELRAQGWRVLATTTATMEAKRLKAFPHSLPRWRVRYPQDVTDLLHEHGLLFIYERQQNNRVIGVEPTVISQLADRMTSDVMLIAAQQTGQHLLSVTAGDDTHIPSDSTLVVQVASMGAVGKPLAAPIVNQPTMIEDRFGFLLNAPIQAPWIAQVLRDPDLSLKPIPERARVVALLSDVPVQPAQRLQARRTAQQILVESRIEAVAIGTLQKPDPIAEVQRRVAAVVLAGGLSSRMGRSKPLLPWGQQTVIEAIVNRLITLRFADVVVVTGHQAGMVKQVLQGSGARVVYNADYERGEMLSSLKAGLGALDKVVSACLMFLGDQPHINPRLIYDILSAYAEGRHRLIIPSHQQRRGHPILLDRTLWGDFFALPVDGTPRQIINAYADQIHYVLTDDANILVDMDTPEAYRAALKRAGLL